MHRRIMICCACLIGWASTAADAGGPIDAVHVHFQPNAASVRTFDRTKGQPPEVGGSPGELKSVTKTDWDFGYSFLYLTECSQCGCQVTVTVISFTIDAHQRTTVFMPVDGTPAMKDHEQGHYALNVYAYRQAANQAFAYGNRMLNRQFTGSNLDEAFAAIGNAFRHEFKDPYAAWRDRLHQAYNDLDRNGHDPKTTGTIAVRKVIAQLG